MNDNLRRLSEAGVAVWLDDPHRSRLVGDLPSLVATGVVGVYGNPVTLPRAVRTGADYADQVRQLAGTATGPDDTVERILVHDARLAADALAATHGDSAGRDGWVATDLDPRLAHDSTGLLASATRLAAAVDRPNVLVKIPATEAGLTAIGDAVAQGVGVNATLVLSVPRYRGVLDAIRSGLDRARAAGRDLGSVSTAVSVCLSLVETEVDKRLWAIGTNDSAALRGQVALANARLCYAAHEEAMATPEWTGLRAAGARPPRPVWTYTAARDPYYLETYYVAGLVARDTVVCLAEKTYAALTTDGPEAEPLVDDAIHPALPAARATMAALRDLRVDYARVEDTVRTAALERLNASWQDLLGSVGGIEADPVTDRTRTA